MGQPCEFQVEEAELRAQEEAAFDGDEARVGSSVCSP
jgi:hypothetical protein